MRVPVGVRYSARRFSFQIISITFHFKYLDARWMSKLQWSTMIKMTRIGKSKSIATSGMTTLQMAVLTVGHLSFLCA